MNNPKIYLAGPSVFALNHVAISKNMKDLCEARGATGLYPLDNEIEKQQGANAPFHMGLAIFRANIAMIDEADAVVADLTPFRGISADVGTVWEVAYAYAKNKIVTAFSQDTSLYSSRVIESSLKAIDLWGEKLIEKKLTPENTQRDHDGLAIEKFDMADNLMIIGSLYCASGKSVSESVVNGGILKYFEEALDLALERINTLSNSNKHSR